MKTLAIVFMMAGCLVGCDRRNYALECLDTAGRRPCVTGSIKYNETAHECRCQTKHRGEVKWDVKKP